MHTILKYSIWLMAILLLIPVTGCNKKHSNNYWLLLLMRGETVEPVPLGTAGDPTAAAGYAILAENAITVIPDPIFSVTVIGNIGLSPQTDYTAPLFNWSLTGLATDPYFDSIHIPPPFHIYCAGNTGGTTITDLAQATGADEGGMIFAYNNAVSRVHSAPASAYYNIGTPVAGILTNYILRPGVYEWDSDVFIPSNLILAGSAADVWIFKVNGNLGMKSGRFVVLEGSALPENIFWQVAGDVTIGGNVQFKGIILSAGSIELWNGATIDGRLLSQTTVDLDMATIIQP